MTNQGNDAKPIEYQVFFAEQTRNQLKQHFLEAIQAGIGQQFLTSLRQIVERLRTDPLNFGEPLYRLPALNLLLDQAIACKLVVGYAIHERRPLVFIRQIRVLS